jgi:membrane protein implicated in regulation of membrane protease activity
VTVGAEVWKAECTTGAALPAGSQVRVVEVRGTRVLVEPVNNPIFEN